jgi:heme exporter protein A
LWSQKKIRDDLSAHRARVHYIGHLDAVKSELTVQEMLGYWGALRGITEKNHTSILETFALTHLASRFIRTLSAGQKRRLSLSRLVLAKTPLWILDEPTTALDEAGQNVLWERIAHHRSQGGIVIAAMHDAPKTLDMQRIEMSGI